MRALALTAMLALAACAPRMAPMGPATVTPRLLDDHVIAADGAELPMRVWRPAGEVRAVILAIHGFNDYSRSFEEPAEAWAQQGILTYAYDQRGFGRAPNHGMWPGTPSLVEDLAAASALVTARHPDLPFAVLGESMGGAVTMVAAAQNRLPQSAGLVLIAPAVRGRETLNVFARGGLWFFAHTVPWLAGRPGGPLYKVSDNIEALRKLGRDPLVIKDTRIDAFWGLMNLMDDALEASRTLDEQTLIQIGAQDDLIPGDPNALMLSRLPPTPPGRRTVAIYPQGYHLLLRDLKAEEPINDIAFWMLHRNAAVQLPSRADRDVSRYVSSR